MKLKSNVGFYGVLLGTALTLPNAFADGFVCNAKDEALQVRVYNHTQAKNGTRNVSTLVISNPMSPLGERTLMRLRSRTSDLRNRGTTYWATLKPEAHYEQSTQTLLGFSLTQVTSLMLKVNFSYAYPVKAGTHVDAVLLVKDAEQERQIDLDCVRYLKGS